MHSYHNIRDQILFFNVKIRATLHLSKFIVEINLKMWKHGLYLLWSTTTPIPLRTTVPCCALVPQDEGKKSSI